MINFGKTPTEAWPIDPAEIRLREELTEKSKMFRKFAPIFYENKWIDHVVITRRKFHSASFQAQRSFILPDNEAESSLWLTTLPKEAMNNLVSQKKRKKMAKLPQMPKGHLLISCKNEKLNFYKGVHYKKFSVVPLASKGWHSKKANGDYFSILPSRPLAAFLLPEDFNPGEKRIDGCDPDEFKSLGISDEVISQLKKMKIHYPTVIQLASIPKILEGKHVLITAETGCGKTLAYVLPIIENILRFKPMFERKFNSPFALILVPTRELALQVGEVVEKLTEGLGISSKVVLANSTKKYLLNFNADCLELVDIVVSTVGVMCKFTYHKIYSLSNCIHLVVDEADTLLDDSFVNKLEVLMKRCKFRFENEEPTDTNIEPSEPTGAQLSFVSATIPRDAQKIVDKVFPSRLMENITSRYLHKLPPHIKHNFVRCKKSDKPQKILELAKKSLKRNEPVMIFSNKVNTTNWLALFLTENNLECVRCHSHMNNEERVENIKKFAKGEVDIIVCSDLTSRGHDIPRVKHVVNYEFPTYMADYVHRCGRTGRIGNEKDCQVTSFLSSKREVPLLMKIELSIRTEKSLSSVDNNITRIIYNKYYGRDL